MTLPLVEDGSAADAPEGRPERHLVVGIGASAGGIEALKALLAGLPPRHGMALILVQQLSPGREELLAEALRPVCPVPVEVAADGALAAPDRLHLVPAGGVVRLKGGRFSIRPPRSVVERRTAVDRFFRSLADDAGPCAVGIVLSGTSSDGALGLEAIGVAGGLAMAQEPDTAAQGEMPASAASVCDHVLPPGELARTLLAYARHIHRLPEGAARVARHRAIHAALPQVCEALRRATGNDFRHYKSTTLVRRLERRMQVLQVADVADYLDRLGDEAEARTLFRELLIGVTSFFRDPDAFEALSAKALGPLLAGRSAADELRIWVPGCATGEEAYSIAMLAREALDALPRPPRLQVFATDIDERALAQARRGSYPQGIAAQMTPERLARFFVRKGRRYQVSPELREACLFTAHNLVSDPPFSRLDLVSCRNLLIYMGPPLQKKLFPVFHYALKPGGFLFLGSSESLAGQGELFRPVDARNRLARRKDAAPAPLPGGLREFGGMSGVRGPDQMVEPDLGAIAQRILLTEFAPRYAIVSEQGQVVHLSEGADKFLQPPVGAYSNAVTRMARRGLSAGLRSALGEAARRRRTVVHELPAVQTTEGLARVRLTVQPMPELGHGEGLYMVVFEDGGSATRPGGPEPGGDARPDADAVIESLERELARAREELERAVQDQEAAGEELKSSNEELLSMNEELQSANEELEAAKEEVQGANRSLEQANADLGNLLRSTRIATVFLDREGRIRSFTPDAAEIYNVRPSDRGRPLDELRCRLASLSEVPAFGEVADRVEPVEEVARHADGRWFLRRVLPYRGGEGGTEGVLVTFVDITTQKRAEEEERRATGLLAAVGETTPDLIFVKDRQGRMLYANPATLRVLGRPAAEVLGRTEIDYHHDRAEAEAIAAADAAVMEAGETRVLDERFTTPGGAARLFRSTKSPMRDGAGAVTGLVGVTADVTQGKRAEEALRAALEFNRRILDSSGDCIEVLSLDGRIESMSAGGQRLMEVDDLGALWGTPWLDLWEEEARGAAAAALEDARRGRTGHFRGAGPSLKGTPRHWDAMATAIAGADGRPERILCISRDVTDQRAAEERLREAATVVENMDEGFLVLDPGFRIKQVNAEGLRIDGRPAAEIVGRHILDVWPEAERFPTWPLYQRAMAERTPGELVYRHSSDLHDVWLETRAYPVGEDLAVFYRDVSDRERAREEAARASRLLEAFVEAVPGVVYAKDRRGRMLVANRGTTELIGKPPEFYLGKTDAEFLDDPAQAAALMATDERIMASGLPEQVEEEVSLPDGRRAVWLSSKAPLRDEGGRVVGLIGSSVDITLRRLAEESLQASEAEFRTRLDAVPQMVWSTRPDGFHDFYNDRWYEFTGVPPGSTDGEAWAGMFHPEDQPAAWERWRRSLATGEPYEVEYRLRHRSGEWRWVLGRALPVRDEEGAIVRWMGTCTDIEDRKRAEAGLAEALGVKEVLLHEVNHRVKNSLQLVTALLLLQAGQAEDPALRRALMEARGRLSVVASMHQRLYTTSRHDRVDFGDYLRDMAAETLRSLDAGGRIGLDVEAEADVVVPLAQAVPLGLIVSELVTNAIKYAFAGREEGRLRLRLAKTPDGARIEVADDGVGLPDGFDVRRGGGLGMRIVTALVRQVRGRLDVASGGTGARFTLELPLGGEG